MKKKIIIDTDCGVDDSLALLCALNSDKLEILCITTVFGNVSVRQAAHNTSYILRMTEREDIPILIGQAKPIVQPLRYPPDFIHGKYGLGTIRSEYTGKNVLTTSAVEYLIQTIRNSDDKITIITIGPLTNIGLALQLAPDIQDNIEEIIVMGGAYQANGNVSPAAEANIYGDAIAAEIVFRSDCLTTMVGLDVTTKVVMDKDYLSVLNNHKLYGNFIKSITGTYYDFHVNCFDIHGITPHDLVTVLYSIDKSLFTTIQGRIYVSADGRMMGQTYVDRRTDIVPGTEWDNRIKSNICTEVNVENLLSEFKNILFQ